MEGKILQYLAPSRTLALAILVATAVSAYVWRHEYVSITLAPGFSTVVQVNRWTGERCVLNERKDFLRGLKRTHNLDPCD